MKLLSRRTHGLADYAVVAVLLSLPLALGLTGAPRTLAYSLAFAHLLITALSSFPPGAFPILPFLLHAFVEIIAGVFMIASPWLLHFADDLAARSTFMIIGAVLLVMAVFTDFDRRKQSEPPPPGDRRRRYSRRGG